MSVRSPERAECSWGNGEGGEGDEATGLWMTTPSESPCAAAPAPAKDAASAELTDGGARALRASERGLGQPAHRSAMLPAHGTL